MEKKNILNSVKKKIAVVVNETYKPEEFFKDRAGLYIWNSFRSNIVLKAIETKKGKKFSLSSSVLLKTSTDEEIENSLPKKHIFSETDVCAIVASLIEKQPKGEEGVLLNDGYANIFYTPSLVVFVYWDGGAWRVDGGHGGGWGEGRRVFSPATEI